MSGCGTRIVLRPLPLLRFAVSATGGAHLCSIQYYLRFGASSYRTSLAVSALRIMRYCLYYFCSYWLQNRKKGRSPYGLRPYILLYAVRLLNQYMPPFKTSTF